MLIRMFSVPVRFVSDTRRGALEAKAGRVVITLARNQGEALQHARARFMDVEGAGVTVEYSDPTQLPDTFTIEALVHT